MFSAPSNVLRVPSRKQQLSPFYPGPHFLAIMKNEELKIGAQIDTYPQMFVRVLFIINWWTRNQVSISRQMNRQNTTHVSNGIFNPPRF